MILKNPEKYGISSERMLKLVQEMDAQVEDLHSIAVVCDNDVVLLKCKEPYTEECRQMMHSFAKSMNSIAVGIAISEGKIHLEDKIADYFRGYLPETYDKRIEDLTVRNLLTMAAGACRYSSYFKGVTDSWIRHYFTYELPHDPGTVFQYDTGASYILSSLITKTMGKTTLELMQERVFSSMGIENVDWLTSPEGNTVGGWGLYLSTPEIAKIGILLANLGRWNGESLVSEEYLKEAGRKQIQTPIEEECPYGYGYQFWIGAEQSFYVFGAFGQCIIVNPQKRMAVAVTAGASDKGGNPNRKISRISNEELIIPTERGELPDNPEALQKLKEHLEGMVLPCAQGERASVLEEKIFCRKIALEENAYHLDALTFSRVDEDRIRIVFEMQGRTIETSAGYQRWESAELVFDDELHHSHSFSYAFEQEDRLVIKQYLLNTSAFDRYVLNFRGDRVEGTIHTTVKIGGAVPTELTGTMN